MIFDAQVEIVPQEAPAPQAPEEEEKPAKKEVKISKIVAANRKSEKYYKQFDFFFNRSCFRIMTEFYKDKFNKFYAQK